MGFGIQILFIDTRDFIKFGTDIRQCSKAIAFHAVIPEFKSQIYKML